MGQKKLACRVCKGASIWEASFLFTYKEQKIISAVPIDEIKDYFKELGAMIVPDQADAPEHPEKTGLKYNYADLEIEVIPYIESGYPNLGMQRHTIIVRGDKTLAEDFLTSYRFRFMSAGG